MSFFNRRDFESENVKKLPSCLNCKARQCTKNPDLQIEGEYKKRILIVTSRPTQETDAKGVHLPGRERRYLSESLDNFGISLKRDCGIIHSVRCVGKSSAEASNTEIDACSRSTINKITELKPLLVFTVGTVALNSVFFSIFSQRSGGVHKFRGWTVPIVSKNFWLSPLLDLSFVCDMVSKGSSEYDVITQNDLAEGLRHLNKKMPDDIVKGIKIVSVNESASELNRLIKLNAGKWTAFDYETTGIKPHAEGHKIISMAAAFEKEGCIVFLVDKTNAEQMESIKKYLTTPKLKRIAHNMKFEHHWSVHFLGITPVWSWDTQLAAHMIDNRKGITSLKHQALLHFGIKGYEEDIKPFLSAGNSNALNNIEKLIKTRNGADRLMTYNAIDAITTLHLAKIQVRKLFGKQKWTGESLWENQL